MDRIKNFTRYIFDMNYRIYKVSLRKSYAEMNMKNLKFSSAFYISRKKLDNFRRDKFIPSTKELIHKSRNDNSNNKSLEIDVNKAVDLGGKYESKYETSNEVETKYSVDSAVEDIRKWLSSDRNDLKPYDMVNEGNYFAIKMPMLSGKLSYKMYKKYDNVYYWYGYYRDLELYLIGNINNVIDCDIVKKDDFLWNPSAMCNSTKFFDDLSNYALDKDNGEELLKTFDFKKIEVINNRTARGSDYLFGWVEMVIRCDKFEITENGVIKIFGSPLIVSALVDPGYGWYNFAKPYSNEENKFYEYDGKTLTGRVLKSDINNGYDIDINRLNNILCYSRQERGKIRMGDFNNYFFNIGIEKISNSSNLIRKIQKHNDIKAFVVPRDIF